MSTNYLNQCNKHAKRPVQIPVCASPRPCVQGRGWGGVEKLPLCPRGGGRRPGAREGSTLTDISMAGGEGGKSPDGHLNGRGRGREVPKAILLFVVFLNS